MVNKVILIGNLGADPELRSTQTGQSVCSLRIATSETYKDKEGQKQERTEWHQVVVWGPQAETVNRYCKKGKQVFVEGRIQTRKWQDKEGKDRYTTEIVADNVRFLSGGVGGASEDAGETGGRSSFNRAGGGDSGGRSSYGRKGSEGGSRPAPVDDAPAYGGGSDDDIPF